MGTKCKQITVLRRFGGRALGAREADFQAPEKGSENENGSARAFTEDCPTRDGRRVVTASADGTARVWDVSLDERPAADWVRLAEFLDGQRLDRSGAAEPLSPQEMQEDWEYLRAAIRRTSA